MVTIVERIVVEHVPALTGMTSETHLSHEHSVHMEEKSNVINLGSIDSNPSTTAGEIDVMDTRHKYVPKVGDKLHKLICNSDQMSVERMEHAKCGRIRGETEEDRLESD